MRKPTPEEWKRIQQVLREGRDARRQMQETIDRVRARLEREKPSS